MHRIEPLEDSPASLRRRRLLQQIDLAFIDLTAEQNAAIDEICEVLPMLDAPDLLQHAAEANRHVVREHLRTLPRTRAIERILSGQWPS